MYAWKMTFRSQINQNFDLMRKRPQYTHSCAVLIHLHFFIHLSSDIWDFHPKKYQKKKSETDAYSTHKLSDDLKKLTPSEKDPNMHTDWTCFIYQR